MSDFLLLFSDHRAGRAGAAPGLLKRTLTVDNTALGEDLTDYPVKVSLTNVDFDFAEANADGGDLRFYADADLTTPLKFDIESWDPEDETAIVFVKVPSIPASATVDVYLTHRAPPLADASDPANTYTFFDDFTSANKHVLPAGSDSGWSAAFDPVSRRVVALGLETHQNGAWKAGCWTHLDTGDVGFTVDLPTLFNKRTMVYHPAKKRIYVYGGRDAPGVLTDEVLSFDPATGLYETLTETLPAPAFMSGQGAVYCPTNGKVYLFGFDGANILVHDPDAGTVTDTGANIPAPEANQDLPCVWCTETARIYLIGGGNGGGTPGYNTIDVYDPANPSADPTPSGITLSEAKTTAALAEYIDPDGNSFLYVFGGFTSALAYTNRIEKITVNGGDETIETLAATLYKADDDAIAFYDSITGRVWSGPWIHSTGGTNEQDRKMVFVALDPTTDALDAEPALGDAPASWTEVGNSTKLKAAAFGSMLRVYERGNTEFVRTQKNLPAALTGVYMMEFRVNPMGLYPVAGQEDNDQFTLQQASGSLRVFRLKNQLGANWIIDPGSTTDTVIASRDVGAWQTLGALVDTANEKVWGLKDRANQTAELSWFNAGAVPDQLWLNTSTTGRGSFVVDWVKVRKCTTGIEPTVTVGAAEPV